MNGTIMRDTYISTLDPMKAKVDSTRITLGRTESKHTGTGRLQLEAAGSSICWGFWMTRTSAAALILGFAINIRKNNIAQKR